MKNKVAPSDGPTTTAPASASAASARLISAYPFVRGFARAPSVMPANKARMEMLPKRRRVSQIANRTTAREIA